MKSTNDKQIDITALGKLQEDLYSQEGVDLTICVRRVVAWAGEILLIGDLDLACLTEALIAAGVKTPIGPTEAFVKFPSDELSEDSFDALDDEDGHAP